jgi:sugar/nucleoside kinase (ribokinase family)
MSRVLCVGQLAADILVRPVDQLDFASDTRRVEPIRLGNGGDGLNVAIGLARLGVSVGFIGLIGEDPWGDFLVSVIDREGIDRRGLKRTGAAGTCSVLVAINSRGERTFFYHGGANDLFAPEHVDPALVAEAEAVHVGGTYLLPRFDGEGAAALFRSARSLGKLTSMDVTWDVTGRWLAVIEPCLPHLDWFLPSVKEAALITGQGGPEDMAAFLRGRGVANLVIKLGERGCYVLPAGEQGFFVPAFPVQVVDTTGAGDSFVAGFLAGLRRGWQPRQCARLACAAAALDIQRVGATAGMPTFAEAGDFMKKADEKRDNG